MRFDICVFSSDVDVAGAVDAFFAVAVYNLRVASIYEIDGKQFKRFFHHHCRCGGRCVVVFIATTSSIPFLRRVYTVCVDIFVCRSHGGNRFYRFQRLLSQLGLAIVWIADRDHLPTTLNSIIIQQPLLRKNSIKIRLFN